MSERKVGQIVTFKSNNGREGWKGCFERLENGELGWGKQYVYEGEDARLVKQEIGLAVQIVDVVADLLKIKHVKAVIQRDLGILIARGLKIYIRDINKSDKFSLIEPPADLDVQHENHNTPELKMSDTGLCVSHCLKQKEKPNWNNIDIYVKHVWIKSIHVDFKVQGWINYNFGLNLARDGIEVNDIYKEALSYDPTDPTNDGKVIQYIRNNYDPLDSPKRKDKINNQKDIEEAFADMLEIMNELFSEDPLELAGDESEKGQTGTIKKGSGNRKWEKIENVSIVDNTGDPNNPIKVIGPGHGGGGGVNHPGSGGQGIEPGGKYTVLRKTGNQDDNTGNVKPSVQIVYGEPSEPKPMAFMPTDGVLFLNEQFNAVKTLLYDMPKNRVFDMLFPLMAEAGIEYQTRNKAELSIPDFRAMVSRLLESMLAEEGEERKEMTSLCYICGKMAEVKAVEKLPNAKTKINATHDDNTVHSWTKVDSIESIGKQPKNMKVQRIKCPQCDKVGKAIAYRDNGDGKTKYYVKHEKIPGQWGRTKNFRIDKSRRCYIPEEKRDIVLKKLGRYIQ